MLQAYLPSLRKIGSLFFRSDHTRNTKNVYEAEKIAEQYHYGACTVHVVSSLTGVVSKKYTGALNMADSNFLCITMAALILPYAYRNVLKNVNT